MPTHFAQKETPQYQEDWKSDDDNSQLEANDRKGFRQLGRADSPGRVRKREIKVDKEQRDQTGRPRIKRAEGQQVEKGVPSPAWLS